MNNQDFFQNKVIVITGASGGIGKAAALIFAQLNAKVVLASRNIEKLEALKQEIESKGGNAIVVKSDVSLFEDTQRIVKETISKWGRIDVLIANAGMYFQDASREIDLESFKRSMNLNSINNHFPRLLDWFYRKFRIEGEMIK